MKAGRKERKKKERKGPVATWIFWVIDKRRYMYIRAKNII